MKKLIMLTFAMLFTASLAFGQSHSIGELLDAYNNVDKTVEGAFIEQVGNENAADVTQNGNTNGATIYQEGPGSEATIAQTGESNIAFISQIVGDAGGQAGPNNATITQDGNNNDAYTIATPQGERFNFVTNINQLGDNNKAGQILYERGNVHMDINQDGNGNVAGQSVDGKYIQGDITQTGNGNVAGQLLEGLGGQYTTETILQIGDDNIALQVGTSSAANGSSYDMQIEQHGIGNLAIQRVNGAYTADTFQNGNGNVATVTQGMN